MDFGNTTVGSHIGFVCESSINAPSVPIDLIEICILYNERFEDGSNFDIERVLLETSVRHGEVSQLIETGIQENKNYPA